MNPPNQTPSHSPLVPQGSIPPKNTSRPKQVLYIAATVVLLHVSGFALVLFQGCQKDAKTAGSTNIETNSTAGLSLPPIGDTNSASMFSTNPAPTAANIYTPPPATGAVTTAAPTPNSNFATPNPGLAEPPISAPATAADALPTTDYKVVANDNLAKIAKKHNITLSALTKANPGLDPRKLAVGKTIKVPAVPLPSTPAPVTSSMAPAPAASPGPTAISGGTVTGNGSYVVRSGDTLTKIARNNGISVNQLRAANNMKTTRVLVGQKLKIPARSAAAAPDTNTTRH